MDNSDIEALVSATSDFDVKNITGILTKFLKNNEFIFTFTNMSKSNKQKLWSALLGLLQRESTEIDALILASMRLLSRDKENINEFITEDLVSALVEKGRLNDAKNESLHLLQEAENKIVIESLKCICNLCYHSQVTSGICGKLKVPQCLVNRLAIYKLNQYNITILQFDLKLLFLLTVFDSEIKTIVSNSDITEHLTNCLVLIVENTSIDNSTHPNDGSKKNLIISDEQQSIICDLLKAQFNLIFRIPTDGEVDDSQKNILLKIIPILGKLLTCEVSNEDKLMLLRNHVANLLICMPYSFYYILTPKLEDGATASHVYEGYEMDAMDALLSFLQYQLSKSNNSNQYENLSPILTVLIKAIRGCHMQRKYLRSIVLPPLRDVSVPPEIGDSLRSQLCRLLTTQVTAIRDLVAEFLFVLCKEKVGRMVKYTGFGNAAGHLAQKGLLSGKLPEVNYSSSDDSDTEEYLEAQPNIDPVVGCTRPPRHNIFDGMSEEQKEYEAMKLVDLFHKMSSKGFIRPARIGADGRPEAIEHVLQLQEERNE